MKYLNLNVDILLVEAGLNDWGAGVSAGEYKYSNWTKKDFTTFRPAFAYMLDYLTKHTRAKIIFMKYEGIDGEIGESIDTICKHYNIPVLVLSNISLTGWHPNVEGMYQIFMQVKDFII